MIFGSVCSGIEAASVAWHPLGWKAAWLAEIEPFPSAVLAHHYPDVPNLGDMTRLPRMVLTGEIPAPDGLVGGTPCQAFSVAGLREGLADERGQLTIKYVELADAIDFVRGRSGLPAAILVWENVPGVLSSRDNAFGCFLGALAGEDQELEPEPCPAAGRSSRYWRWDKKSGQHTPSWPNAGAVVGPARTIAWRVLDAQYFGLAQRRRRVFVVASARKGFDPAAVLFEFDGVRRDSAPSRETWEDLAAGTLRSTDGGIDVDHACAGHLIAGTLQANGKAAGSATQQDAEAGLLVVHGSEPILCMAHGQGGAEIARECRTTLTCNHEAPIVVHGTQDPDVRIDLAHTLGRNNGAENAVLAFDTTQITSPHNRSDLEYGNPCHPLSANAHPPAIAFSCKDYGNDATADLAPTLRAMGHSSSHANAGGQLAVCITGEITHTLKAEGFDASEDGTGRGQPIVPAYSIALRGRDGGATAEMGDDLAGCLRASTGGGDKPHVLTTRDVAQTLTSNYGKQCDNSDTALGPNVAIHGMAVRRLTPAECEKLQGFPVGHTDVPYRGKPTADGPRYKALGNSMAVACMAWIGKRIQQQLAMLEQQRSAA